MTKISESYTHPFDYWITGLMTLLCLFVGLYVSIFCQASEYWDMALQPLAFGVAFLFSFYPSLKLEFRLFNYTFFAVSLLRFVLLPLVIVLGGYYTTNSSVHPAKNTFITANVLMLYELAVSSLLLHCLNGRNRKLDARQTELSKANTQEIRSYLAYWLFIAAALVIFLLLPRSRQTVSFFLAKSKESVRAAESSLLGNIMAYWVNLAKQLACVLCMVVATRHYRRSKQLQYLLLVLLAALINIIIFNGLNRSDFLMSTLSTIYLLALLYPKEWKKMVLALIPLAIIAFVSITLSRDYQQLRQSQLYILGRDMNAYAGGLGNVALAVETYEYFPQYRTIPVFFNEFLRGTLGFNLIFKPLNLPYTSQLFNQRIYFSDHMTQIIPMIGEGYYFLGPMGAPIFGAFFLFLGDALNNLQIRKGLPKELVYFLSITCIRLGFMQGQNATIQMNDLSFNLFVFVPLFLANLKLSPWLNRLVKRR